MDAIELTDPKLARQVEILSGWYRLTPEQLLANYARRAIDALIADIPNLAELIDLK